MLVSSLLPLVDVTRIEFIKKCNVTKKTGLHQAIKQHNSPITFVSQMSSVFVTVGSTSFDALVAAVCSKEVLQLLAGNGVREVVLQVGRGRLPPRLAAAEGGLLRIEDEDDEVGRGSATASTVPPLRVEWFRYKDSLREDVASASLVLGHAGAGTILESLAAGTPLVCVLNDSLLHNHQGELAEQMEAEGRLRACPSASRLPETLRAHFGGKGASMPLISEPRMFSAFLEDFMGIR